MKEIQGELVIIKPQLEQSKQEEAQLRRQYTQRHTEYENIKRDMAKIQHSLQENEKKKYKAPDIASHVSIYYFIRSVIKVRFLKKILIHFQG